ncbi:MAG TPA: hypothetical protein VIN08_22715 [Ohtaekwangia sp.]|uniref:hypothetical protein n=1 Tax=Ohtaekwangia sp. TaxID=2066019 RepID=UPI002F91C71C
MKRAWCLYILILLNAIQLFGQEKKFEELNPDLIEWGEGSILLNDGQELKGLVRFNDKNGIVSFESGNTSRSYVPRSVAAFEFYDEKLKRQRVFYSLEFEDKDNVKRPFFFEVLRDFKTFAVISKIDPVEIEQWTTSPASFSSNGITTVVGGTGGTVTKITQTETIYFLGSKGEIEPYLKLMRKIVDRTLYDRKKTKQKILDDDILRKYFNESEISNMIDYSEKNNLHFDNKEEFIKILASA